MRNTGTHGLGRYRRERHASGAQRRLPRVRRLPLVAGRGHDGRDRPGSRGAACRDLSCRPRRPHVPDDGRTQVRTIDDAGPQQRLPAGPRRAQGHFQPQAGGRRRGREGDRQRRARRGLTKRIQPGIRVRSSDTHRRRGHRLAATGGNRDRHVERRQASPRHVAARGRHLGRPREAPPAGWWTMTSADVATATPGAEQQHRNHAERDEPRRGGVRDSAAGVGPGLV